MSGNSHLDSFIDLPHVNSSCVRIRLCDAKSTVMQLDDVVNPNARSLALQRHLCSSNPGRVACRHCNASLSHAGLWGKRIAVERITVAVFQLRFYHEGVGGSSSVKNTLYQWTFMRPTKKYVNASRNTNPSNLGTTISKIHDFLFPMSM